MRVLGLECSSDISSVALLEEGCVVLERVWDGHTHGRQAWAADVAALVHGGELPLERVETLAVGVGPGAFSGLRMAIAFMRGLALPAGTPVYGVSSGAALAWRVHADTGACDVIVAGDARRNEVWVGRFDRGACGMEPRGAWAVVPHDLLPDHFREGEALWVSPDWHRIGPWLKTGCPAGHRLLEKRCVPQARDVATLAALGIGAGRPSAPLAPIYLHPAVFVEPRFAAVT